MTWNVNSFDSNSPLLSFSIVRTPVMFHYEQIYRSPFTANVRARSRDANNQNAFLPNLGSHHSPLTHHCSQPDHLSFLYQPHRSLNSQPYRTMTDSRKSEPDFATSTEQLVCQVFSLRIAGTSQPVDCYGRLFSGEKIDRMNTWLDGLPYN